MTATTEVSPKENGKQEKVLSDKEALALIQGFAKELGYTIEGTATYPQSCMALKLYNPEIINDILAYVQKGVVVKKL